jgi:hypothetical protein
MKDGPLLLRGHGVVEKVEIHLAYFAVKKDFLNSPNCSLVF